MWKEERKECKWKNERNKKRKGRLNGRTRNRNSEIGEEKEGKKVRNVKLSYCMKFDHSMTLVLLHLVFLL